MLTIDLTNIDPAAPLLIECWFCGHDRIYHDYDHFTNEQARSNEWLNDADGNILCVPCALDRYPELIW